MPTDEHRYRTKAGETKGNLLTYHNDSNIGWTEWIQDPSRQFLQLGPEDWPDQIILASLPQVPQDQIDIPITQKVGRCEGPIQNRSSVAFVPTDAKVTFYLPNSTRFVRVVLDDGREVMERYNTDRHGEWDDIPDTGLTPAELIQQLYGFGETVVEQGEQFGKIRKRTSSKIHWNPRHHPTPKVQGFWKK